MFWINDGFVLDDVSIRLTTSYIDLRDEGEWTAIGSLVKGCRRKKARQDAKTVLISKPERLREYGMGRKESQGKRQ